MFAVKWRICLLCLLLVGTALGRGKPMDPAPGGRMTSDASLSPRLGAALAAGTITEYKIWVHFEPRPLGEAALAGALAAAADELTPRAARRRAKMHAPGAALVNLHDLPLDPVRLQACQETGARLRQTSRWLNAASFLATPDQVARLGQLSGVRQVDLVRASVRAAVPTPVGPVAPLTIPTSPGLQKAGTIDYGASQTALLQANVIAAHEMGLSGRGVLIGLVDTGFRVTHEALAGIPVLGAWDFVNQDNNVDFDAGDPTSAVNHGTMTLSTMAGFAPGRLVGSAYGASVALAKTEDVAVEVPLEEDNWVAGLEWAEALGADILSSSLGYVDWYEATDLDGNTAVTTIAADLAAARGLIVVTSAGNDRATSGHLIAPADADSIVTVGAVDAGGNTAGFSSPGPTADGRIKPDVAALGVGNTVANPTDDTSYLTASGTSFSCPLTAGVVALMLERVPSLTPVQVLEALRSTASHSNVPDNDQGWGIINAAAAVTWFGPVIELSELLPTSDPVGPYPVKTVITDRLGVDPASVRLHYRVSGGAWQELLMTDSGEPNGFRTDLPGQPLLSQVDYYVTAASTNGVATSFPYAGADAPLTFFVTASSPVGEGRLPAVTVLGPAVPNPFNPQTAISFVAAAAGPVHLRVYDLRGLLVRTLLASDVPAGPGAVQWDGRDDAGSAVASGTYLYRLSGQGWSQQRKMQLVR